MKRMWNLFNTSAVATALMAFASASASAQAPTNASEPVFRVSKNEPVAPGFAQPHALDPAIQLAHQSLAHMKSTVKDYTAILIKRELIDGELGDYEYMFAKIRNRQEQNGQVVTPFSVYLTFLKPAAVKGREVIFVENANEGKVVAHEGGMKRMLGTHTLEPNGWLAMKGQRYPITDIGIENLLVKLIERGNRDRAHGDCNVEFLQGAKVSGRDCRVIQVTHPAKSGPYDFHIAQIFMDEEFQIPGSLRCLRLAKNRWGRAASYRRVHLPKHQG